REECPEIGTWDFEKIYGRAPLSGFMQEYDVALKTLLCRSATATIQALIGTGIAEWIDVELPKVQNTRADLLGWTIEKELVHIELQSTNDPGMALRMAEYCLSIFRLHEQFPRQILLYVGAAPMRMSAELRGPRLRFEYQIVDIRDFDGE